MGVSRTRSKGIKRATEEHIGGGDDGDAQDQPIESSVPKTSQLNRQGNDDIWDVGAVYNTDKIMPKKSIVTYSKKKYKARPELGSLLTSFHSKASHQPKRADANHQVSSSSLFKETKELHSQTTPTTADISNGTEMTTNLPRNDKEPENLISTQDDTHHVDQDHDKDINATDFNDPTLTSSSVAAGKQKASSNKKKSLSISRTRREKQLEMNQSEGQQGDIPDGSIKTTRHGDGSEIDHTKTPHVDEAELGFEGLQDSLDRLNLSPIGNINSATKRIVSSTPVGFRIQQQRHVSKPIKSFSESLKQANIDLGDMAANEEDGIATSAVAAPVSLRPGMDSGDVNPQDPLAPASVTSLILPQVTKAVPQDTEPVPQPTMALPPPTYTLPNLEEQRKTIEASIAEPSLHQVSNAPIWSPPRSPSIEMARRQSQRSDTQNTIPEGLFEWFGNSIQSQAASSEPNHNIDEELGNFLTPDQLDMTVEQFMRSIYEDKVEQIRKEGQKRIDRLNEELARVRAKLLAELDS